MSTLLPVLIAVAVVLPLLVGIFYLHRYIHRHQQPDYARLQVLRGILWFVAVLGVAYLSVHLVVRSASGNSLVYVSFLAVISSILVSMHQIQKRLRRP